MISLTQKEELTKIRQLSNIYSFIYLRDYQERNNQFWRGIIIYAWYFVQMTGLFVLCSNKAISENLSTAGGSSSTTIFELWMKITIYSRFNPILSYFSDRFVVPAIYFTILLMIDILFIYFFSFLSKKSTKIQENNFKKYQNFIIFVSYYMDLFRWFYLSLKTEIILARFLCTSTSDSNNQTLCSYLPNFKDLNTGESTTLYILCSLNIISLLICFILVFIINHSGEFTPSNPFKSRYSEIKILEYVLIVICQYLAFQTDNSFVYLGINIKIFYYLFEYFSFFPLYRSDLSGYYLKILTVFIYCSILMTLREFTNFIGESFHLEILFIGASFIFGFITVLYRQIKIHIMTLKLSDEPVSYPNIVVQHFFEILALYQQILHQSPHAKLQLNGILTTHQSTCVDEFCPCQYDQEKLDREMGEEKDGKEQKEIQEVQYKKKRGRIVIEKDIGVKIIEKKQEEIVKGVYFTELMNKEEQFQKWIYEYINYHFRYLIFKSKKERNYNMEDISMKFWFFLVNDRHNIINGLYTIKSQLEDLTGKSYFLQIIDLSITRMIENNVKQKDRSLKYSYRKKDMEEAIQYGIFEQFVLSEVIKDRFKKDLIVLLDQKVSLMQSMIEGYEELDTMQNQMLSLITSSTKLENLVKNELRFSSSNLHYLKMLSILRIRIQNDPIFASKIEKKIEEVHSKSLQQDVNLIHSLTVLNGNVISVIASFKKEKGKILKYSERAPQFFGYKKTAFDSSVKNVVQLMPNIISINHDQIIERLIIEGTPKIMRTYRVAIAKDKDGFLFPIKIYINYYYQINDDFVFSALILKLTSQSSYLLLNSVFQIEGITKTFLEFLNKLDENITKEMMDKLPLQLFLPDLPDLIKQSHTNKTKMESVKLPMIIPDHCSRYFMGFRSYLKKMQGRDTTDKKIVESFMSNSRKYFREDVYIFEWNMNVVQDTFKLLNGFEFTVYQIEIQHIIPVQVIQNGLKTTYKSSQGESDSFAPNTVRLSQNQSNFQHKMKHKHSLDFESTMFTKQYSQDQIKKKFNFKQGNSNVTSFSEFNSDPKSVMQSTKNYTHSQSGFSPKKQDNPNRKNNILLNQIMNESNSYISNKQIGTNNNLDSNPNNDEILEKSYQIDEQQLNMNSKENMKTAVSSQQELIFLKSFAQDETQATNQLIGQRNDLLMEMTEEELNKLRRSYDDIDLGASQGIMKNHINVVFPARIDLIQNQQQCDDTLIHYKQAKQQNQEYEKQQSKQKKLEDNLSNQASLDENTNQLLNQNINNTQDSGKQQTSNNQKNDDEKKQKIKQRMSVIKEQLNDSDIEVNLTTQGVFDSKLNETQQNLITQQFGNDANMTNQSFIQNTGMSPTYFAGNLIKYDVKDTINMTNQISYSNRYDSIEKNSQNNIPCSHQDIDKDYKDEDEYDKKYEYNKNKSVASNFFNSQQVITRNSSYDKDTNPVQLNLQILKESTHFSKNKDNPQQELSDGPTIEQLDEAESSKNRTAEKEEVRLKPLENEQRAQSVASSQTSQISTTIQRIYYSASSKRMPFFMGLFFQVIGFQLLFFGSICAIVCVIFNSNYQSLNSLTQELNFSSKILIPYSQNTLILNAFSMQNEQMIQFSSLYLTLSNEIQKKSLDQMKIDVYDIINQHVKYDFQSDYLSEQIKVFTSSDGTHFEQQIFFFESIKTIYENLNYFLVSSKNDIMLYLDFIYNIKMNYYSIEDLISTQVSSGANSQITVIHQNIEQLNKNVIIVSSVLLFFCFVLLFYPFWRYSQYVKSVLLSVSRMTEKEAESEIIFCKFISSILKSSDEKYLAIKYTNFDMNQIQSEDLGIMSHFNSQSKKNQQKTHLKKNYMLSQRINQPKIRLLHFITYFTGLFLFSVAIFSTVIQSINQYYNFSLVKQHIYIILNKQAYSIIYEFNNSLIPALDTYQNFLIAFQSYSSFIYSTDQIFTQRLIEINKKSNGQLPNDFIDLLNERRQKDLKQFKSFFEADFLILTQKGIYSDSLNSYINDVQTTNLCVQQGIFTEQQLISCQSAMSSIMIQGLKVVISKISDDVGMKEINSWSDQLVLDHIKVKEYESQLQAVQQEILKDIKKLIEQYINQIILIYCLGGVLYALAFLIVCYSVYKNIYRRFFLIKKTVHLMPYKRLQEDQTTINLIKNALEG